VGWPLLFVPDLSLLRPCLRHQNVTPPTQQDPCTIGQSAGNEPPHEEHDAALQQVLSAEQYAKLRKSREDHEKRLGTRHNGPKPR
jgi:hypothetical protein